MISISKKMTIPFLAGGAALLLAVLAPVVASVAGTTVTCSPTKVKLLTTELNFSSTTSLSFGNIPEARVSFKQGVGGGCVIVRFSAQTNVPLSEAVMIRAFLDNATPAIPDEVSYLGAITQGPFSGAQSFDFVFPSVAAGNHVVRMQFKSAFGGSVSVHRHTTIVQFTP